MKKIFLIFVLIFSFFVQNCAFSDEIPDENTYLQNKSFFEKISFWKKRKKKKQEEKMPKTYQQWQKVAQSEPVVKRENPKINPEPNKKLTKVLSREPFFVKYNIPAGGREIDLSKIMKDSTLNSKGVVDETFSKMAYVTYFYYPTYNQISSKLFVLPLNKTQTRIKRVEDANLLKSSRINNFEVNMDSFKEGYYSLMTILDWNNNSDRILVKNKIGTLESGIFRTELYSVSVDEDCEILSYHKIDFEDVIKKHYREQSNIVLNLYRWDIKPLGYNSNDENEVISYAWAFDKNNKKVFLGVWGANLETDEIYLISSDYTPYEISSHGIVLEYKLP